jgi:hypothetical protein
MRTYGEQPKIRYKIHSADECYLCKATKPPNKKKARQQAKEECESAELPQHHVHRR